MKEFSCGAVVPGCDMKFEADSESAILEQVAVHAGEAHGMSEVPPEVVEQVRANIHDTE
jgi:predicted small metal-binding protein